MERPGAVARGAAGKAAAAALMLAALCAVPPADGAGARGDAGGDRIDRAMALARQGRFEQAAGELRAHLRERPDDAEAYFHLGRVLGQVELGAGRAPLEAAEAMESSLRLDPSRDVVRLHLVEMYAQRLPGLFRPQRLVALFDEMIGAHPDRPELRVQYARALITAEVRLSKAGDPSRVLQDSAWTMDVARFHLEKAIDGAAPGTPMAVEARTLLAEVQLRSGEWDAARATFESLLASDAGRQLNRAIAFETIGHCRWRKGEHREAVEAFRRSLAVSVRPSAQWGLLLAAEALGGYPPDVPPAHRFPLRDESPTPAEKHSLRFTDIAPELHIDKLAGAGPCGWADYDGDGRLDLLACGCDTFCTLYRAEGKGFVDATARAGLTRLEPGFGAAWGDYDNDGDPDLYIARNGWNGPAPNSLMRNQGDGTFTDVAAAAGVDDGGSSFHAAWLDYDRDGWLDLIVSNGVYIDGSTTQLYRNRANGTFENVTVKAGLAARPGYGTIGVAIGDYDQDGWSDIFLHGRFEANRLFRNQRDGTFRDLAAAAGVAGDGRQNGYIAFFSDLDSDGDLDIFTGSLAPWDQVLLGYRSDHQPAPMADLPRLYRNDGGGSFTDVSWQAGFRHPLGIMAAGIADLDNDGYQDIYLGTGNPEIQRMEPNIFYRNQQGESFRDLTRTSGLGALGKGHGITFLDWDGDGDLEIFAELGGFYHGDLWHSAFYRNDGRGGNHWLSIQLRQEGLNRDAIGAHVTVSAGSWKQVQQVTAGRGFGSTDPPVLHFGLGRADRADRVDVVWPDGARRTLRGVRAGRPLEIRREEDPAGP
ncbi:MAG TPA: FG-GAP-like repeat-containing protein [Candidatus Polarisedimenticolia bacterium]|nr:FG-GAP-like repeat-containing protein [Candidatus Polarisedimenticolia bacterium]